MKLEELIQKRFTEREGLTKFLVKFGDYPAIFSPEAPKDNQNWGTDVHYPRLVYNYDMQADEERKSAGTLSVSLLCQNTEDATEEDITPEMLEPLVRDCLKDVLLHSEDGKLYAFAWNRTDAFELAESKTDLIIGSDVRFDILEYTSQETTDPDPVMAMNKFVKELYPECIVVGLDRMEEITEASRETPVIYCRLNSMEKVEETNTVVWMDGKLAIHILCPDTDMRLKMAAAITNAMSLDGEVTMLDYSPMFIRKLQMDNKSDYLKDGQIFVTGRYGLLRYKANHIQLNRTTQNIFRRYEDAKNKSRIHSRCSGGTENRCCRRYCTGTGRRAKSSGRIRVHNRGTCRRGRKHFQSPKRMCCCGIKSRRSNNVYSV